MARTRRERRDPAFAPTQRTTRLEAFSDGVFAIAITLLVLELSVSPADGQSLGEALVEEWASYLAYAASFFTIGAIWLAHSTITEFLQRADPVILRINLVLLALVGLLPFPTTLVAEYVHDSGDERVAVTLYGVLLALLLLVTGAMWRYALAVGLVKDEVTDNEKRELTKRVSPALLLYVGAIGVGLVAPVLAVVAYLSIAVMVLTPIRSAYRAVRRSPSGDASA